MGFILADHRHAGADRRRAGRSIGHFYQGSSADLVDWKPTRSPEVEAQNEIDDVRQMLEAQNEMRRRRGAAEVDEDALRAEVEEEELERLRRGDPFEA